jgi:hypothetical protein
MNRGVSWRALLCVHLAGRRSPASTLELTAGSTVLFFGLVWAWLDHVSMKMRGSTITASTYPAGCRVVESGTEPGLGGVLENQGYPRNTVRFHEKPLNQTVSPFFRSDRGLGVGSAAGCAPPPRDSVDGWTA